METALQRMTTNQDLTVITGAGGFLGSALVQHAGRSGYKIRATSRSAQTSARETDFHQADILDLNAMERVFEGATTVIHAAGLAHVLGADSRRPEAFNALNVQGTRNVMTAATRCSVSHVVLVSSVSVYGGASRGERDENCVCKPEGPYATSKLESERIAIEEAGCGGVRLTILRMATIYGSGDPGNVARLIRAIDRSRFVWIGSGSNRKSLIHKEDAARACFAPVNSPGPTVEVFNVSNAPVTIREIVETIGSALGRTVPDWHIPPRGILAVLKAIEILAGRGAPTARVRAALSKWTSDDSYSADKLQNKLGLKPRIGLSEGMEEETRGYSQAAGAAPLLKAWSAGGVKRSFGWR
jgi:nucleoside-diphosphate-sugar epimerase